MQLDVIYCGDCRRMLEVPAESVHLVVTSPPYNVGKAYESDLSLGDYRRFLADFMCECYRVLVDGGRLCVNIAGTGRKPYVPLQAYATVAAEGAGFRMRGDVIWYKGAAAGASTGWGSWRSASNPVLRDVHEYVLVFGKGSFGRDGSGRPWTMSGEDFLRNTKSVWELGTESARRVGHPAPFPVELPRRLIDLYSFEGDVVLDPFMGSGTTALAAVELGRRFVGYELREDYVRLAHRRLDELGLLALR